MFRVKRPASTGSAWRARKADATAHAPDGGNGGRNARPGVKTTPWLVSLLVVAALTVAACGDDAGSSDTGASGDGGSSSEKQLKLGVSSASLEDPFQAILQRKVVEMAKAGGAEALEPTNANNDPAKQVADVNTLLNQGATGLLIVPRDNSAVVPALEQAESEGVPSVVIDQAPAGGTVFMTVRADNYGMGASACEEIGKALDGKGKVLELQGDVATVNGRDRTDGFEDCMKEKYPDIEVIAKPTKWKANVATDQTQTALTADPDINAIYLQSDSVMLPGVLGVLKRKDMLEPAGQPGHVYLAAIDGTKFAHDAIRKGELDIVVSQPLPLYAKYGIAYLEQALKGEQPVVGPTDHGSKIEEVDGLLQDQLPAPVVSKDNVDDPELWGNQAAE